MSTTLSVPRMMKFLSSPLLLIVLAMGCTLLIGLQFPRILRDIFPYGRCPTVHLPDVPGGTSHSHMEAFARCAGPQGVKAYLRFSRREDTFFPILYSLLFAGLSYRIFYLSHRPFPIRGLHFLAFAIGLMDLAENALVRQQLQHPESYLFKICLVTGWGKWALAVAGLHLLLIGTLYRWRMAYVTNFS